MPQQSGFEDFAGATVNFIAFKQVLHLSQFFEFSEDFLERDLVAQHLLRHSFLLHQ